MYQKQVAFVIELRCCELFGHVEKSVKEQCLDRECGM